MEGKPSSDKERMHERVNFSSEEFLGDRAAQEDYSLLRISRGGAELLAVLADGMGGHAGGEVASKRAVDSFAATFGSYPQGSVSAKLGAALHQANNDISFSIKNSPALDGMGCTLVAAHIDEEGLQWISVGDSPLFLFRNKGLTRLNADHSMAPVIEKSLLKGKITTQEANDHPNRHVLRSAVTGGALALVDTSSSPKPLLMGDVVILASDGLLTLTEKEISALINEKNGATAEQLVETLITAVKNKKKPRQDNTTVQIVLVPSSRGNTDQYRPLEWLAILLTGVVTVMALFLTGVGDWFKGLGKISTPSLQRSVDPAPILISPTPSPVPKDPPLPPTKEAAPKPPAPVPVTPKTEKTNDPPATSGAKQTHKPPVEDKATPSQRKIDRAPTAPQPATKESPKPIPPIPGQGTAPREGEAPNAEGKGLVNKGPDPKSGKPPELKNPQNSAESMKSPSSSTNNTAEQLKIIPQVISTEPQPTAPSK